MRDRRRFLGGMGAAATGLLAGPFVLRARAADALAPAAVDPRGPLLGPLLARNREKHPGPRMSNHFSMAILSLASLGGSGNQVRALADGRLERLEPFPIRGPAVSGQTWRSFLGKAEALPGLRAHFTAEVARLGVGGALRTYVPDLLPGLGAHAFHAIIRTAYGVRFGDPAEVATGLAYWAATFLPLGPLRGPGATPDPVAALSAVRAQPALTTEGRRRKGIATPAGLNIAEHMSWASQLPGFEMAAAALRVGDGSLPAIARTTVRLFLASGDDFTALHAVTGTHAYRILEPHLPDRNTGRRHLWQALIAAYVTIGAPRPDTRPAPRLPPWSEVVARATTSRDDHELKLTDICREEARHYGDDSYRWAAASYLELT